VSNAQALLAGIMWVSVVGLILGLALLRAPKKRSTLDVVEGAVAALKLRVVDIEDKFEHYTKREAVRGMRARKDEAESQQPLPLDKAAHLSALRARVAQLAGGRRNGIAQ